MKPAIRWGTLIFLIVVMATMVTQAERNAKASGESASILIVDANGNPARK